MNYQTMLYLTNSLAWLKHAKRELETSWDKHVDVNKKYADKLAREQETVENLIVNIELLLEGGDDDN